MMDLGRRRRRGAARPLVLLVDADASSRRVIAAALLAAGLDVRAAKNGLELDAQISEAMAVPRVGTVPSAIVAVLRHGEQTIESLCRLCVCEWGIPVVAVTALGDEEAEARADRMGAAYAIRQLDLDRIREAVDEVLDSEPPASLRAG